MHTKVFVDVTYLTHAHVCKSTYDLSENKLKVNNSNVLLKWFDVSTS